MKGDTNDQHIFNSFIISMEHYSYRSCSSTWNRACSPYRSQHSWQKDAEGQCVIDFEVRLRLAHL